MDKRHKILVVDDEREFLNIVKEALELRDFDVITAENAIEAGLKLATNIPSLIVMDIKMPGIDGIEACKAIKRNPATKDIPIVIISGLAENVYAGMLSKIGVKDYFAKPINIKKLLERIQKVVK